jgi:hypothetical protein
MLAVPRCQWHAGIGARPRLCTCTSLAGCQCRLEWKTLAAIFHCRVANGPGASGSGALRLRLQSWSGPGALQQAPAPQGDNLKVPDAWLQCCATGPGQPPLAARMARAASATSSWRFLAGPMPVANLKSGGELDSEGCGPQASLSHGAGRAAGRAACQCLVGG